MIVIGDVHGKIREFGTQAAKHAPEFVVQLGDMGAGFVHIPHYLPHVKFIRGNHDDPAVCRSHPNYLGDYGTLAYEDKHIFYLGGAYSIDWKWREPGVSWWRDEELGWPELRGAFEMYSEYKPDIVLTHEAPEIASTRLLQKTHQRPEKFECGDSRTAQALRQMFECHQPELWVFGHYHMSETFKIGKTVFRCLSELESMKLPTKVLSLT